MQSLTLEFAGASPTGGVFRLTPVRPGVVYSLEASTDLRNWDRLSEHLYEVAGPGTLYDLRTTSDAQERSFYRVTIRPNF